MLLFGITREITGKNEIIIENQSAMAVRDLMEQMKLKYPDLRKLKSLVVAVNNEYAEEDFQLSLHDEIALIPPVSGG